MENPFELLKQMGTMQETMKTIKGEIDNLSTTGESGAGLVKVTIKGNRKVQKIEIDPSLFKEESIDALEVLLISAFNNASEKIEDESNEYMQKNLSHFIPKQ